MGLLVLIGMTIGGFVPEAWGAGADTFVAGTAVFGAADPAAAVRNLIRRCAVRV